MKIVSVLDAGNELIIILSCVQSLETTSQLGTGNFSGGPKTQVPSRRDMNPGTQFSAP